MSDESGDTYFRIVRFVPDAGGDDGDPGGGNASGGAALLLEEPWKITAGVKANVQRAVCSYQEYQNLGGQLGVTGSVQFCYADDTDPDLTLANVILLDAEPMEYGQPADGGGMMAVKYHLTFTDDRYRFVEPRGGRLRKGLLNPSVTAPQSADRTNVPATQKLSQLITFCLTAMGLTGVDVPTAVDAVDPPEDLKWFGTHAPTELGRLLAIADCVLVLQPDGTYEIHQRGVGSDPQIPGGRALPPATLDGSDARGKTVVFTSFPTQVAMVLRVSGTDGDDVDPGVFEVVARNASSGSWDPVVPATAIAALNAGQAGADPAVQEGAFRYVRLDPDIYDPLVSPLLRKTWPDPVTPAGGGDPTVPPQVDLQVSAIVAVPDPVTKLWANSPAPVQIPVVGVYDGNVIKLGLRLVRLPSGSAAVADPDRTCVALDIEDLQFRIAVGVSEWDATDQLFGPGYFYTGFSGTPGQLTTLDAADAESAMSDPGTVVVTLPDLVAVQYGETATDPANKQALVDRCRAMAARYLRDASKPPRVLAAVGFLDFTFDGTLTEVEVDQRAVLTRFRMDSWFRPAGSYLGEEFGRLRRKAERHPHQAETQGDRQAAGAAGSSAPVQPMNPYVPPSAAAGVLYGTVSVAYRPGDKIVQMTPCGPGGTVATPPPADVKVMIYGNDAAPLLLAANKGDVLPYLATANGPTLPAASNGSSGSNASSGSAPPAGTLLSPPVLPNGGSQYMVLQVNGAGLGVFDWVRAH